MAKAVGAWPSLWGRGRGRGCVAKAVGAATKPWGCGQDCGGVAEASMVQIFLQLQWTQVGVKFLES